MTILEVVEPATGMLENGRVSLDVRRWYVGESVRRLKRASGMGCAKALGSFDSALRASLRMTTLCYPPATGRCVAA
jgi:hypothetical protein